MTGSSLNLGYWATVEHAATWDADRALLQSITDNGGRLSADVAKKIAGIYKVARTFHGVAAKGYGPIAGIINGITLIPGQSFDVRVTAAVQATHAIAALGYTANPSAVSKWLWFRAPDNWYIYDQLAARAVGAGTSSVRGMRGFFAILQSCDVQAIHDRIAAIIIASGLDLRPERVIDKFLWLAGAKDSASVISSARVRHASLVADASALHDLATQISDILPDDQFVPLKDRP